LGSLERVATKIGSEGVVKARKGAEAQQFLRLGGFLNAGPAFLLLHLGNFLGGLAGRLLRLDEGLEDVGHRGVAQVEPLAQVRNLEVSIVMELKEGPFGLSVVGGTWELMRR
jgi:hypothetical protein